MKTVYWIICLLVVSSELLAQTTETKLDKAVKLLLADSQMRYAVMGISVVKTANGEKVFAYNDQIGLAPASCQKIFTSTAALEMLRPDFRYETQFGYDGSIRNGILNGDLYLVGMGDPSFGSFRFLATQPDTVFNAWMTSMKKAGITRVNGNLFGVDSRWERETLPGGWIWDDIGNYYGAGSSALNWRENQNELKLQSGSEIGSPVKIITAKPVPIDVSFESELHAAAKGTGDNAYIYLAPYSTRAFVRGTIPVEQSSFTIAGSFPDPALQLVAEFSVKLDSAKLAPNHFMAFHQKMLPELKPLLTLYSPTLDSLNYWFLKKSINLYGECLIKTMASVQHKKATTEEGVKLLKSFWKEHGIDPAAIHIIDGSGLSPQNRITADALITALQFATHQSWYHSFYDALPVFNQMKLKSGTIAGAKSFAGYHLAKDGTSYTVAFIINNYDGTGSEIVRKMFRVLDELK